MRSLKAPLETWSFAEDAAERGAPADEPFELLRAGQRYPQGAQHAGTPHVPQAPHDFTRILAAEDDAFNRRVLRVLLSSPRMSVIEVEEGQAAIDLLALRSFDLLILDLTLPLMTGEDVIRWIRRHNTPWNDIPILGLVEDFDAPGRRPADLAGHVGLDGQAAVAPPSGRQDRAPVARPVDAGL